MAVYGGIEAGGTKFVCAVGNEKGKITQQVTIPTTTPNETMPQVISFFNEMNRTAPIDAFGIGSFGPVDPNIDSETYGYITSTPKTAWTQYNLLGAIQREFNVPIGFDTDVNAACLGEYYWGAGKGLKTFMYITVGTGVGAGIMTEGKLLHGLMHPEAGHIFVPHDKEKDPFEGVCPFHQDCLEGLASGPAINKRWNVDASLDLSDTHPGWDLESDYLAYALANYIMILSPQRIIMGGGVMKQTHLLGKIRPKVLAFLNGYIKQNRILFDIENYIVSPGLGVQSGIYGAIALATQAATGV